MDSILSRMKTTTSLHYELQQAAMEEIARERYIKMERLMEQQDAASWVEFMRGERDKHLAEAMEIINDFQCESYSTSPNDEMEDLELAARLKELAKRIEAKYS